MQSWAREQSSAMRAPQRNVSHCWRRGRWRWLDLGCRSAVPAGARGRHESEGAWQLEEKLRLIWETPTPGWSDASCGGQGRQTRLGAWRSRWRVIMSAARRLSALPGREVVKPSRHLSRTRRKKRHARFRSGCLDPVTRRRQLGQRANEIDNPAVLGQVRRRQNPRLWCSPAPQGL